MTTEQTILTVHGVEHDPDADPPPRIGAAGVVASIVLLVLAFVFARPHDRLLKLLLAVCVVTPIHTLGFVIAGRAVGMRIARVAIYYGGAVFRALVGQTWVAAGWFPTGGYVKFDGVGAHAAGEPPAPGTWNAVHPLGRATVAVSGSTLLLAFACVLIGPRAALTEAAEIPRQTSDAFSGHFRDLLRHFFQFVDQANLRWVIGVVAAKFAALNLLPVPILNGGQAILELLQWPMRRPLRPRVLKFLQVAGLIAIMTFYIYFISTAPFSWRDATATLIAP